MLYRVVCWAYFPRSKPVSLGKTFINIPTVGPNSEKTLVLSGVIEDWSSKPVFGVYLRNIEKVRPEGAI